MKEHVRKHGIIYIIVALGFINAFVARFKDTTPAQRAQMYAMDWSVAYAQVAGAGLLSWIAYLKRSKDSDDEDPGPAPTGAPPSPAPSASAAPSAPAPSQ